MTIQTMKGTVAIPETPVAYGGAASNSSLTLNAASYKAAMIFQAPKTGSITAVIWRANSIATGCTLDVRLETVDTSANGDPTGTLVGTTTNGAEVLTTGDGNSFRTTTLTLGASVTKGDLLAVVIAQPSSGSGSVQVGLFSDQSMQFPYCDLYTTSWFKQAAVSMICALQYSDGSIECITGNMPVLVSTRTFNSSSAIDESGIKITLPFPCRVVGFWVWGDFDAAADVILYDTDGTTTLASASINSFVRVNANNGIHFLTSSATPDMLAATYRLTVLPTTTTNITLNELTTPTAAFMDALALGQNCILTTRANAGSWTDTTTGRALVGLLVSGFESGGRNGGILRPVTASASGDN